jgi:hypothetical protein
MIQVNQILLKDTPKEILLNDFNILINSFKDKYPAIYDTMQSDNKEYDLTKKYEINHVCIWNKVRSHLTEGLIFAKNDKIALVAIPLSNENILDLYRLEDLTLIN